MKWLDQPPAVQMNVVRETKTELQLEGPHVNARVAPGITAGVGATLTAMALRMLRAPLPGPIKLIPAAFTLVGAGVTALGLGGVFAKCSVRVTREGVEWKWRYGPLKERTARVEAKEVRAVEVRALVHHASDSDGWSQSWTTYCVQVVTKAGVVMALEEQWSEAPAQRRREQVEALLAAGSAPRPPAARKSGARKPPTAGTSAAGRKRPRRRS